MKMKSLLLNRWKRFTTLGITDDLSSGEAKRVKLVNKIGAIVSLMMVPFVFQYMDMGLLPGALASVFSIFCFMCSIWCNARRWYIPARYMTLVGGGLINIFVISNVMGFENGDHTALTMTMLYTFMLFDLKQRGHLLVGLLSTILCWVLLEVGNYQWLGTYDIDPGLQRTNYTVTFSMTLFFMILIAYHFQNLSNRQVNDIVYRAQQELKAVFNNSYDALLLVNRNTWKVEECNRPSLEILHKDALKEIVGKSADDFFRNPVDDEARQIIRERVGRGEKWSEEFELRAEQGQRWANVAFSAVRYGERNALLVRITDVTAEKMVAVRMQEAKERAESANKAKDQFLANMSHELRTPLNGILGMSQLIQMTSEDETLNGYAHVLEESGERLLNVFNTMLELSRLQTIQRLDDLAPADIRGLVESHLKAFQEQASAKGLDFQLELGEGTFEPMLKEEFFVESMRQVLSNAIKFTEDGQVSVKLEKSETGDAVRLIVSDTGIGMSEEFLRKKLFNQFEQESDGYTRNYEGTGLGLALTKRMTELMNGEITVQSQRSKGTSVSFQFPLGSTGN